VNNSQALAESSSGIHFSFEKQDSVSCEAIYESVSSFERVRNAAGNVDRFAISEADHLKLRELVNELGEASTTELGDAAMITWLHDGHKFIHQHVAVKHDGRVSCGLITKWVPESEEGDPALWHMVHDDGDEEDLEEDEVSSAIQLFAEESGRLQMEQQVSGRGRKRAVVDFAQLALGPKGGKKRSKKG